MLGRTITRRGTLLIKGGEVYLDGWEANGSVTCRELSALACLYSAQDLMERARSLIEKPGGDGLTCADMPHDTRKPILRGALVRTNTEIPVTVGGACVGIVPPGSVGMVETDPEKGLAEVRFFDGGMSIYVEVGNLEWANP